MYEDRTFCSTNIPTNLSVETAALVTLYLFLDYMGRALFLMRIGKSKAVRPFQPDGVFWFHVTNLM
jgi:hypothetical protein